MAPSFTPLVIALMRSCVLFVCRFRESSNMTDRMAALTVLCDHDTPCRTEALQVSWQSSTHADLANGRATVCVWRFGVDGVESMLHAAQHSMLREGPCVVCAAV